MPAVPAETYANILAEVLVLGQCLPNLTPDSPSSGRGSPTGPHVCDVLGRCAPMAFPPPLLAINVTSGQQWPRGGRCGEGWRNRGQQGDKCGATMLRGG